jgi:HK97 gp10 family phage protein
MPIRLRLEGGESLARKLNALGEAVRGRALERAVVAGALIVQDAAKQRAPYKTGNLRRSIHVGGVGDLHDTTGGQIEGPVRSPNHVEVLVGTNVEYARQREYGGTITPVNGQWLSWRDAEGTWHRARSVTQAATPYLRPALDENAAAVRTEVGEALRDLLRAAVG